MFFSCNKHQSTRIEMMLIHVNSCLTWIKFCLFQNLFWVWLDWLDSGSLLLYLFYLSFLPLSLWNTETFTGSGPKSGHCGWRSAVGKVSLSSFQSLFISLFFPFSLFTAWNVSPLYSLFSLFSLFIDFSKYYICHIHFKSCLSVLKQCLNTLDSEKSVMHSEFLN